MNKPKLLIVDDDAAIRNQLKWSLETEFEILLAENAKDALRHFSEAQPELVALDISLDGADTEGLEILREMMQINSKPKVVIITGRNERELALEAISLGAFDHYTKPLDPEEIKIIFRRAAHIFYLEKENETLSSALAEKKKFEDIIGDSTQMKEVFNLIRKVATTDATVLISGESGTGKELVAKAIHYQSLRREFPFVVINCAAIPETLLESELFGHERGSFTGAYTQKIGKFEIANGGTIFLDEIGELPLSLQVKLLRFLQERVIERVGSNESKKVDVRIIAATNSDLKEKINQKLFREDLFWRICVVSIFLPPLRQRNQDIEILAHFFLKKFSQENSKRIKGFTKMAMQAILSYPWPGNVRELENKIKRAVILSNNSFISPEDLGLQAKDFSSGKGLRQRVEELEKRLLLEALAKRRHRIAEVARDLRISRSSVYDLMKKYGIT